MLRRWLPAAILLAAGCRDNPAAHGHGASRLSAKPPPPASGVAAVKVRVIDRDTGDPVPDVQVVFHGDHGDINVRTRGDGTFDMTVPHGTYRAFVRDSRVISTGLEGRARVKSPARPELAGAPDERLMSIVDVDGDIKALELPVAVAGTIEGTIVNEQGVAVAGAVIAAVPLEDAMPPPSPRGGRFIPARSVRPVLGSDTAISDASGAVVLRVPPGRYRLTGYHAAYAGLSDDPHIPPIEVQAGTRAEVRPVLGKGCVISGKVIGTRGEPAHDGAMEVSTDRGRFAPLDRIRSDGTFRWSTIDDSSIDLRAWPWESAPSPTRTFECTYGKRIENVVLRTGNELPDLVGTLLDASGTPVPLAYLDVTPLAPGIEGQQERADASGHFEVYELPADRYQLTASVPGRGMVSMMVVAPRNDIALHLGGTGRIVGTATDLVDGSFELVFHECGGGSSLVELDEDTRLVTVRGGRFTVDHVPACALTYTVQWHDKTIPGNIVVEPQRTAYLEVAVGTPRKKIVRGVVRDNEGAPAANARISALVDNEEIASVRADGNGAFELHVPSGAALVASNGKRVGRGTVGRANVNEERVELVLDERSGAQ